MKSLNVKWLPSSAFNSLFSNICNLLIFHSILIGFAADFMDLYGLAYQIHIALNVAVSFNDKPLMCQLQRNSFAFLVC